MKITRHPMHSASAEAVPSNFSSLMDLVEQDREAGMQARPQQQQTPQVSDNHSRIKVSTLSFGNMHKYGELFSDLMQVRKRVFIEKRGWVLPSVDGYEFDQYDNPFSRWIVLHQYGEIFAGVRLTPTTAKCGVYSYMIRDAQRGLLANIPSDLLICKAPVSPTVWEASRIFVTDEVPGRMRLEVQGLLLQSMAKTARKLGASFVIGIVPCLWSRWIRRLKIDAGAYGPKREIEGERCQVVLMNTQLNYH